MYSKKSKYQALKKASTLVAALWKGKQQRVNYAKDRRDIICIQVRIFVANAIQSNRPIRHFGEVDVRELRFLN
jgi:hypothetical protein